MMVMPKPAQQHEEQEAKERKALAALWWCTNGPAWVQALGWEEASAAGGDGKQQQQQQQCLLGEWDGVGVDPELQGVTLIDLRRNNLQGALPPEIGDLTHLRHLYLGDNQLQGT
ncbi:unnamed protein product [Ectocarpus sp. 12 AP-2014]